MTWVAADDLDCLHCAYLAEWEDVANGWECPLCGCIGAARVAGHFNAAGQANGPMIEVEQINAKPLPAEVKAAYRLGGMLAVMNFDRSAVGTGNIGIHARGVLRARA